jgi:hypothetical protein
VQNPATRKGAISICPWEEMIFAALALLPGVFGLFADQADKIW